MSKAKSVVPVEEKLTEMVDENDWTDSDVEIIDAPPPEENQPDTKCTGCKHLVIAQNAVFWPQMCYQNRGNIVNLWTDEDGDPARSELCVAEMLKETA